MPLGLTDVDQLIRNVNYLEAPCPPEYWMETPAMGYVFATRFQCALIVLNDRNSHTCFPIIAAGGVHSSVYNNVACIAYFGRHYVPVSYR